jgi:uncharacterized protein
VRPRRLSDRPFPPRPYRPGQTPHPRRHPAGHSVGAPEPEPGLDSLRYGIDLFHAGFWWESHEQFEAAWQAAEPGSAERRLLAALIQLAAAELKRATGGPAAERLARRALCNLGELQGRVLGFSIAALTAAVRAVLEDPAAPPLVLPHEDT